MNILALAALVVAALVASIDWWSVWTARPAVETVAKPLVMVALIVAAIGIDDGEVRSFIMVGLGLGLVGDVLLLPALDRFAAGLAAFLIGHLAYAFAFVLVGTQLAWLVAGIVLVGVAGSLIGQPIVGSASVSLRAPIMAYIIVIAAMVSTAVATRAAPIMIGGVMFAGSDGVLGWDRFVNPRLDRRVFVHALYHTGQLLIVAGSIASMAQ